MHVGKPPGRVVQLGGGDAQIKEHPLGLLHTGRPQQRRQIGKVAVEQCHTAPPGSQELFRRVNGGLIPVNADKAPGGQPPGNLPAVARPAQRPVQVDPVRADVQGLDALLQKHRLVGQHFFHTLEPQLAHTGGHLFRGHLLLVLIPELGAPNLRPVVDP